MMKQLILLPFACSTHIMTNCADKKYRVTKCKLQSDALHQNDGFRFDGLILMHILRKCARHCVAKSFFYSGIECDKNLTLKKRFVLKENSEKKFFYEQGVATNLCSFMNFEPDLRNFNSYFFCKNLNIS